MSTEFSLLFSLFISLLAFAVLWGLSLPGRNLGILDVYWGPGFAVIAIFHMIIGGKIVAETLILTLLTVLWGSRLGLYLLIRHTAHEGEDRRYARMRSNGGEQFWWRSLIKICFLQGLIMWLIATPQHVGILYLSGDIALHKTSFWIGVFLFAAGFAFEAVADWQLYQFKKQPQNKDRTMTSGLWALSRHPNYFGEIVLWWGLGLMGFAIDGMIIAFAGPALLTFLLLNVSGVPMLEGHLSEAKDGYRDYVKSTSTLIPRRRK